MDERGKMKQFIVETQSGTSTFYSLVEAEDEEKAIQIKEFDVSIGCGRVTGVSHSIGAGGNPLFGETIQDVTFIEETVITVTLTDR